MRPHAADTDADTGRDLVRPLLRHLPDVIFRLSRDQIFLEHIPTDGRRVGAFADPIIGLPIEQALPPAQADETTRALARALRSGEMQRLDYVAWEEDERHVIEGRVVATGDRDALLMLLDATEQRAVGAASEAIVETSHALVADGSFGAICEDVAAILARQLEYAFVRIEIRHPDVPGTNVVALHGEAGSCDEAIGQASRAAGESERAAVVGVAASVPIMDGNGVLGSISVAGDRPRRLHPAVVRALESVAASLVNVRNSERAETALAYQARTLRVYEDTGRLLAATLDLDEILDALAREIVDTGVFRSLMVALVDERAGAVRVVRNLSREPDGSIGDGGAGVIGTTYRLDDDNITPQVARTGELSVLRGWDDRYDHRFSDPEAYSRRRVAYFIPVKKGDRVLAVLATGSQADEEAETLQRIEDMSGLLAQVAVALDHAMLYRETQLAREEMRAVMTGARCLLWHATVEAGEPEEDGGRRPLSWDTRAFDAEAAQRFMQLDVAAGETYEAAWYASKVADDVQPMYDTAADALLGGASGYSQEFRNYSATGAAGMKGFPSKAS